MFIGKCIKFADIITEFLKNVAVFKLLVSWKIKNISNKLIAFERAHFLFLFSNTRVESYFLRSVITHVRHSIKKYNTRWMSKYSISNLLSNLIPVLFMRTKCKRNPACRNIYDSKVTENLPLKYVR